MKRAYLKLNAITDELKTSSPERSGQAIRPLKINFVRMKTLRNLFTILFISGLFLTSCEQKEFDTPPHDQPVYAGDITHTISEFKAKYNSSLVEITDADVISGVVTANDISGNLYKQVFIEDETGGLMIAIDRNNIYNDLRVGQTVFIECKGLYMGKYGDFPQLGYRYSRNNDGVYSIGQIPWEMAQTKLFRHDYPKPENVVPKAITFDELTEENLGRLVMLENVSFDDAGKIFSEPSEDGSVQTLNRLIRSNENPNQTVTGRMSSAANFASQTIPSGIGKVTGVLTKYNTTIQFLLRELGDVNFEPNPDGWGTKESPWTSTYALGIQNNDRAGWVKGYIVGTIAAGINETNPITKNSDLTLQAPFVLNNYVVIANDANETDWAKCLVVNLPEGSALRTAVNLVDHPENKGQELIVKGSLQTLLGAGGVNVATGSTSEFIFGDMGQTLLEASFSASLDPFVQYSVSGDQTWVYDSYGYAKMTGYQNSSNYANEDWLISPAIDLTEYSAAHITFEHVSRYGDNANDLTLWVSTNYNGGAPASATWTQVPIANYSSGTSWTDWTNSGQLNVPAELTGQANFRFAFKYLSTSSKAGTWEVKNAQLISGPGDTTTNPEDPTLPVGDGTRENPYNIAAVVDNQGAAGSFWSTGYIVGTVEGMSITTDATFTGPFATPSNILIALSPTETDYTKCVPVQLPSGAVRTALNLVDNPGNLGKEVSVYGTLEAYFSVPGIKTVSNYIIDGTTLNPNDPEDALFSHNFLTGLSPFTTVSVTGDQTWTHSTSYGAVISGFVSGTNNANEDWLISPAIDLSGATAATLGFEHALNYSTVQSQHTLWISSDYTSGAPSGATWTQLTIPNYPPGTNWTFIASGDIAIPAEFLGQNGVTIAFKYISTTSNSGTWEIKNVTIN